MIKLSVITVCLNCADKIVATMESIFQQTYESIEIIVIDGGSNDGTIDYVKSVNDKVSIMISEPDNGIYDAMNKGIKLATADYIIFLNAGDRFRDCQVVEKILTDQEILQTKPKLISGRIQFEHNGRLLNLFRPMNSNDKDIDFNQQATFIDTTLQKKNFFDPKLQFVGDHELCLRLRAQALFKVKYVPNVISIFSLGGRSNDPHYDMRRYLERIYVDSRYSGKFGFKEAASLFVKPMVRRIIFSLMGPKNYYIFLGYREKNGFWRNKTDCI